MTSAPAPSSSAVRSCPRVLVLGLGPTGRRAAEAVEPYGASTVAEEVLLAAADGAVPDVAIVVAAPLEAEGTVAASVLRNWRAQGSLMMTVAIGDAGVGPDVVGPVVRVAGEAAAVAALRAVVEPLTRSQGLIDVRALRRVLSAGGAGALLTARTAGPRRIAEAGQALTAQAGSLLAEARSTILHLSPASLTLKDVDDLLAILAETMPEPVTVVFTGDEPEDRDGTLVASLLVFTSGRKA